MKILLLLLCTVAVTSINAAVYYVDWDGGSDLNAGTSTGAAWKHSPGDSGASGNAAITLAAGDTVNFKGGVRYRGSMSIASSGTQNSYITHQGDAAIHGWGTGRSVIDGSEAWSPTWTVCTNASEVLGNPLFASIYWATIPVAFSNTAFQTIIYNNTNVCGLAQEPNPTNVVLMDIVSSWRTATESTSKWLKDTVGITNSSSTFYNESVLGRWLAGNTMQYATITNYQPSTNTIFFADNSVASGSPSYYSIFNNRFYLDAPGEYASVTNEGRIYIYPPLAVNPSAISFSIACRKFAWQCVSKKYNRISGFEISGMFGALTDAGYVGIAVTGSADLASQNTGLTVDNCYIVNNRSMNRSWMITMGVGMTSATNNTVIRNYGGGVFSGGSTNVLVANSTFSNLTGTAIYMNGATNSLISNNIIWSVQGTHANGASIYGQGAAVSYAVTFANNEVRNSPTLLTMEVDSETRIVNNLFDACGENQWVQCWGGQPSNMRTYYLCNTLVNNPVSHNMLRIMFEGGTNYVLDNIIDGGGVDYSATPEQVFAYNLFVGLASSWSQSTNKFGPHCLLQTNLNTVFSSLTRWSPNLNGPTIGAGTNLISYGVLNDKSFNARSATGPWTIGAFEPSGVSVQFSGAVSMSGKITQ